MNDYDPWLKNKIILPAFRFVQDLTPRDFESEFHVIVDNYADENKQVGENHMPFRDALINMFYDEWDRNHINEAGILARIEIREDVLKGLLKNDAEIQVELLDEPTINDGRYQTYTAERHAYVFYSIIEELRKTNQKKARELQNIIEKRELPPNKEHR